MKRGRRVLRLAAETVRVLQDDRLRAVAGGLELRTNTWPACGPCWPDPSGVSVEPI